MFKYLTLATGAMSQMQPMGNSFAPPAAPVQVAQPMGGMDPMMMMLLLNDNKDSSDSSLKKLLPLMMMQGGNMGGMDPMMMMLMLDDDSSSSDDSLSSLLPLMMMNGGMGGAGGAQAAGGMNPMMMMLLMGDDCKPADAFKKLTTDEKKAVAKGEKFTITAAADAVTANLLTKTQFDALQATDKAKALKNVDYKYLRCDKGGSGMSDLLPLMMMGGQGGAMGGMDPMMMMLLMDDSSSDMSDMLPLMMMNGGMGGQPGQAGAMNPMMLMLLGDDDKKEKAACYRKYEIAHAIAKDGSKKTTGADIVAVIEAMKATPADFGLTELPAGYLKDFSDCIVAAGTTVGDYSKTKSSTDKLLPLMMMGGMGGQGGAAMDPMMMMLLLKD